MEAGHREACPHIRVYAYIYIYIYIYRCILLSPPAPITPITPITSLSLILSLILVSSGSDSRGRAAEIECASVFCPHLGGAATCTPVSPPPSLSLRVCVRVCARACYLHRILFSTFSRCCCFPLSVLVHVDATLTREGAALTPLSPLPSLSLPLFPPSSPSPERLLPWPLLSVSARFHLVFAP